MGGSHGRARVGDRAAVGRLEEAEQVGAKFGLACRGSLSDFGLEAVAKIADGGGQSQVTDRLIYGREALVLVLREHFLAAGVGGSGQKAGRQEVGVGDGNALACLGGGFLVAAAAGDGEAEGRGEQAETNAF